jgi:hypothetical protein
MKTRARGEQAREGFAARLTEVALAEAAAHGVGGPSIDLELDLWKALGSVVANAGDQDDLPAELTEAAFRVVLDYGFSGSFLEMELGLWKALRRAFGRLRGPRRAPCPT